MLSRVKTYRVRRRLHVYSDPASERHFNHLAPVESPERFPTALAGSVAATIRGVEEEQEATPEYTENLRPVEAARKVLAPFWGSLR